MTACDAGANGKGFPHQSGNFRRAVGTGEDVDNSTLTSTLLRIGWPDRPTSSRQSDST
jgi:hypothetical protein